MDALSFKKNYLGVDLLLQSLLFWPTLLLIPVLPFSLIGLFLLGALQLLSAFSGWLLLQDPVRGIYLGSSLLYLGAFYGFMEYVADQVLPGAEFGFWAFLLLLIPPVIGGAWYYFRTKREWQRTRKASTWV